MAKCKLCNNNVSNGTEYCDDCIEKKDLIDNELYLDNFSIDLEDIEDFDNLDITEDLNHDDVAEIEAALNSDTSVDISEDGDINPQDNIDNEFLQMDNQENQNDNEDMIDSELDDILNELEMFSDDIILEEYNTEDNDYSDKEVKYDNLEDENNYLEEDELSPENQLLNLLEKFDPENPVDDDVAAITELLGGFAASNDESSHKEEVFDEFEQFAYEAFSAEAEEDSITEIKAESVTETKAELKTELKVEANTTADDLADKSLEVFQEDAPPNDDNKKKKKRRERKSRKKEKAELFVNIEEADIQEIEEITIEPETDKEKKVKGKKVKDKKVKEKKIKEPKVKKAKKVKKTKKAKKERQKQDMTEVIEEMDNGRISLLAASIVFVLFGIMTTLFLFSSKRYSYSISIKSATDYFSRQRYDEAYDKIYGIELKDEDVALYDKIMTVMFVKKQLNSYKSYYKMEKYPEALDALLKGLQRYDKYIELAKMLGIESDFDNIKNQILAELKNVFNLTNEQADSIINSETKAKYSLKIHDVVLKNLYSN